MGHYLSDFESDEEFRHRTKYGPMLEKLRRFRDEAKRGLVHTRDWEQLMGRYHSELEAAGYDLRDLP